MAKKQSSASKFIPLVIVSLVAIGVGAGMGWYMRKDSSGEVLGGLGGKSTIVEVPTDSSQIVKGAVFGSPNADDFKDVAEGYLQIGTDVGEGSHMLLRIGGKSQTVYLFSSVTDLDQFDGMEVKVFGETQQGQVAGWLMDVGRLEVVNVEGAKPLE